MSSRLAVGSLAAVQGVTLAAEAPGKIVAITFQAGSNVRAGDLLVRQDTSVEEAQLPGAEANEVLAKANLTRAAALVQDQAIAQAEYDSALATHSEAVAEVARLRAVIAKKTVRAPFAGRLGIRLINWTWALALIAPARRLSDRRERLVLSAVHRQLWEINRKYSRHSSANNHLVGEAAGVFVAASYFCGLRDADRWRARAHRTESRT